VGDKSISDIVAAAEREGVSAFEIVRNSVNKSGPGASVVKPAQCQRLKVFVETIDAIREAALDVCVYPQFFPRTFSG
jgi:hypothetical protein